MHSSSHADINEHDATKSVYIANSPSPSITTAFMRGRQNACQKTGCTSHRYMPSDFLEADKSIQRTTWLFTLRRLHIPNMARVIPSVKGDVYRTGLTFPNHIPSSPENTRLPIDGIRKANENTPRTARQAIRDGGFAM